MTIPEHLLVFCSGLLSHLYWDTGMCEVFDAYVALVSDRPFYEGRNNEGIYRFFREEYSVYGCIFKPTGVGKNKDSIALTSRYDFIWQDLSDGRKYYIIEI
ncbi:hypothetical protein [Syntrophomonas wolfei]|uniref:hypothetical protein n=1 Tax=Syntrophomonas wolfei TaxID=863 RepID=UPI001F61163D|nr:hypothetical protein [Syntrophomonas wolfei]